MTGNQSRLLRWYPQAWRDRYGEEFLMFLQDSFGSEKPPLAARLSIMAGGLRERVRHSGLSGDTVPPADRVRAGVLMVLGSWTAMVVAGASFAKMSEQFDTALPQGAGAHYLPDLFYTFIQSAAGAAGLIVVAAAALVVPALMRFLRSGGWPSIRGHALRAIGCTVLTVGMTAPLLVWAHHLSPSQRIGGSTGYGILFLVWAAFIVGSLILWTVLAVVAARRVTIARSVLAVEAVLAVAVTFAVVAILAATSVWWALMAERAPSFLSGHPASLIGTRLVGTVLLMALAAAAAITGAARITRCLPEWRNH